MFRRGSRTNKRGESQIGGEQGFSPDGRRQGLLDGNFLDGLFSQGQFSSALREFVHPGKEPGELLMRCFFKDERQANAAVLWLAKCEEFGLDRHKKLLLHKLAASTSIKGLSRKELLQATTGIVAPSLYGRDGTGEKER